MKVKKLLSILLALTMVLSLLPVSAMAASYADAEGHWAEAAINRWSDYGIVTGDERGFRPNDNMTRAEAAKVLSELFGLTSTAGATTFTDVPADAWYANYIAKANAAGIMGGVGDNQANPNGTLTRETFFVMFARGLGLKEQSTTSGVAADGDSWANGYINALTDKGYVKGDGTGVNALANINRASVMSLLDQTISQYVNTSGETTLTADKGIVLVNAKNVTLTGTTNADVVIAKGASNGSVAFSKATVNGAVTVQADNAKVTADKDSKLAATPVVNGAGSTYTAANGTTISGGGGSTITKTNPADWYVTQTRAAAYISSDAEAAALVASSGGTFDGDVYVTSALGDGSITITGPFEITGSLIIQGGGSGTVNISNVTIDESIVFDKKEGATPRVNAGTSTTVGEGVIVNSGSTGAILDNTGGATANVFKEVTSAASDVTLQGSATLSSVNVTGTDVSVNVTSSAGTAITTVTVAENASASIDGTASKVATVAAKGDVEINTAVANITASGNNTDITLNADVTNVSVTGGSAGITGSGNVSSSITASAGSVTVGSSGTNPGVTVTGSNVTVAADNGAAIATVTVNQGASATLAEGENGGSFGTVTTKGNVTVNADVTTVTVDPATVGNVTVSVGNDATIGTVSAENTTGKTVIASTGSGGTITTVTAKTNVDVNGENATVTTVDVPDTNGTATTITVNAGTVETVDAKAATTVTTGNSAASAKATVGSVKADTVADVSVNATVVEKVEVTSNTGEVKVDAKAATDTLEVEIAPGANTSGASIKSESTNGDRVLTTNTTVTSTDASKTVAVTNSSNEDVAVTVKAKSGDPTVAFDGARNKITVTTAASTGKLYVYASSTATDAIKTTDVSSTTTKITLDAKYDKVYVAYDRDGKADDAADGTALVSNRVATADITKLTLKYGASSIAAGRIGDTTSINLTPTVSGGLSGLAKTYSISGTKPSWLAFNTSTGALSSSDRNAQNDEVTLTITVSNGDDSASFRITVGKTDKALSPTPVAYFTGGTKGDDLSSNRDLKKITVEPASAKSFAAGDTIALYADSAKTTQLGTTYTVTGSGDTSSKEFTLTESPKGAVYVLYTQKNAESAPLVSTTNYPVFSVVESGESASVLNDIVFTKGDNATFPTDRKLVVTGGASKSASAASYDWALTGVDWLEITDTNASGAISVVSGKNVPTSLAKTLVTVTATDGAGAKLTRTFYITINSNKVYPSSLTISNPSLVTSGATKTVSLAEGATLELTAAYGPENVSEVPTIAWSVDPDANVKFVTVANEEQGTTQQVTSIDNATKVTIIGAKAGTTATVTAKITYNDGEEKTVTDSVTVTVPANKYGISLNSPATTIQSGTADKQLEYVATVTNNGAAISDNVTYTVALKADTTHVKKTEVNSDGAVTGIAKFGDTVESVDEPDEDGQAVPETYEANVLNIKKNLFFGGDASIVVTITATSSKSTEKAPVVATRDLTITAADYTTPDAPTVKATAPTSAGSETGTIAIYWNGDAEGLAFEYADNSSFNNATTVPEADETVDGDADEEETDSPVATIEGLAAGTYYVRVKANATNGLSAGKAATAIVPAYTATVTITADENTITVPAQDNDDSGNVATITPTVKANGETVPNPGENLTFTVKVGDKVLAGTSAVGVTGYAWDGSARTLTVSAGASAAKVTITATYKSGETEFTSNTLTITVNGGNAADITLSKTVSEEEVIYAQGDTATALDSTATSTQGTLTYQWYSAVKNGENKPTVEDGKVTANAGTAISGATSATYTPGNTATGTTYYYCIVTNSEANKTATTKASAVATITVRELETVELEVAAIIDASQTKATVDHFSMYFFNPATGVWLTSEQITALKLTVDDIDIKIGDSNTKLALNGNYGENGYADGLKVAEAASGADLSEGAGRLMVQLTNNFPKTNANKTQTITVAATRNENVKYTYTQRHEIFEDDYVLPFLYKFTITTPDRDVAGATDATLKDGEGETAATLVKKSDAQDGSIVKTNEDNAVFFATDSVLEDGAYTLSVTVDETAYTAEVTVEKGTFTYANIEMTEETEQTNP